MKVLWCILVGWLAAGSAWGQQIVSSRTWQFGRNAGLGYPLLVGDTLYAYGSNSTLYVQYGRSGRFLRSFYIYRFQSDLSTIDSAYSPVLAHYCMGLKKSPTGFLDISEVIDTTTSKDSLIVQHYTREGWPLGYFVMDRFLTEYYKTVYTFDMASDGALIVEGLVETHSTGWDLFAARFGIDGHLDWAYTYPKPGDQQPTAMTPDTAGGMLISADNNGQLYTLAINAQGEEQSWQAHDRQRTAYLGAGNTKRLPGGGFVGIYAADSTFAFAEDGQGSTVWRKFTYSIIVPSSLQVFEDGSIAFYLKGHAAGRTYAAAADSLVKLDPQTGQVLWKAATTEIGSKLCEASGFAYTPEGDAYITGQCTRNMSRANFDYWLCKVDNLGRVYDPSQVKQGAWVARATGLDIGPNPASASFALYNLPEGRPCQIKLRDGLGRVVREVTVSNKQQVPVAGLAKGLYSVEAGGKVARLVVE